MKVVQRCASDLWEKRFYAITSSRPVPSSVLRTVTRAEARGQRTVGVSLVPPILSGLVWVLNL
jgi:hypothetical protein